MLIGTIKAIEGDVTLDSKNGWQGPPELVNYLTAFCPVESISVSDGLWGVALIQQAAKRLKSPLEFNPDALKHADDDDGRCY